MNKIKFTLFVFTLMFCLFSLFMSTFAGIAYKPPGDFDGDGKTDYAIYRPDNGQWWVRRSSDGSYFVFTFGLSTDKPVPADYTGDGKADIAVWRPNTGEWFILRSEDFSYYSVPFGLSTDKPVAADYDGDGKTDIAVWRESNGTWYIQKSTGGFDFFVFGTTGDKPVPADYDGDGKADISVSRITAWWTRQSSNGAVFASAIQNYSAFPTIPTYFFPGDFTGDGRADQALYSEVVYNWVYRNNSVGGGNIVYIGNHPDFVPGVIPIPGDYDGDRKLDIAMFNLNNFSWRVSNANGSLISTFNWGTGGDIPIPFALTRKNYE